MKRILRLAYQPYKWILVVPVILITTLILSLACIFTGLFAGQDAANYMAVFWARICCAVVPIKVKVKGRRHYRKDAAYVIVANHQSMADIPAVHAFLGLNIKWIMKKELKKVPVFGSACHLLGCIYVDRKNPDEAIRSIKDAEKKLSPKASVLFFAEGTRSRDGKVMPFKKGAFKFAMETGLPVLPVTIKNSLRILPSDSLNLIPGEIDIIVHPPMDLSASRWADIEETIDRTRRIICSAL